MSGLYRLTSSVSLVVLALSGCSGSVHKIPVPAGAQEVERHEMPRIEANQADFYLTTKKDDMSVFGFYSKKFEEKGWILCRRAGSWIDYEKIVGDHEQANIHQNSSYMAFPARKQLLMVSARYFPNDSGDTDLKPTEGKLRQYVKVVLYQLDDRGYAMAVKKYACAPGN